MRLTTNRPRTMWVTIAALSLATVACGPSAVVGDWESKESLSGERNELEVADDNKATATVYAFIDDTFYEIEFDGDWEEQDNGDIEFDLECDGNCGQLDLKLECELSSDGEEMDCKADEPWRGYDFEWERQ